jgi:hypothetical protein
MQDILNQLQPYLLWSLATLGTLVSIAGVASKWIPKDSALGPWVAWFATMPIGHAPTKLSRQVARVEAAIEQQGEIKP